MARRARTQKREAAAAAVREASGPSPGDTAAPRPLLPGPWQVHVAACLGLIIATLALYAGDLDIGFLSLDDPANVVDNPWIRGASWPNVTHLLTQIHFAKFTPTLHLSYMLDHSFNGLDPHVFHLSSNLWAGLVAATVYLFGVALLGSWPAALAAAALFVVHPVHVETVVWISSRKDLVATTLGLCATLTYLAYRRRPGRTLGWYGATLVLFVIAVGGKQSVVVLPALWALGDMLLDSRGLKASALDKLPFAAIATLFAVRTLGAEPPTGYEPDLAVTGKGLLQSAWLLTGFGDYVAVRERPAGGGWSGVLFAAVPLVAALLLAAGWAAHVLRRWLPALGVVLYTWILLALAPQQALSFVHPVADRYLFLSSVGVVLLIGWAALATTRRFGRAGVTTAALALVVLGAAWTRGTLAYVAEWRDPRSVWFGATAKSDDTNVHFYLGSSYQDASDKLVERRAQAKPGSIDDPRRLAELVWQGDARLQPLLADWAAGTQGGATETAFREHLRGLAWEQFEQSRATRGRRVMPNLFFRRGKLLLDGGRPAEARAEFEQALAQSELSTFDDTRRSLSVYCHRALGIIAWGQGSYDEALRLLRIAETEQAQAGGRWIPSLTAERQKLEGIIARQP